MTIEEIQKSTEFQVFDRKSARIDAKALAITIIAFANADGGQIALGVEDDGTLTGVDGKTDHVNGLLCTVDSYFNGIHGRDGHEWQAQPYHSDDGAAERPSAC